MNKHLNSLQGDYLHVMACRLQLAGLFEKRYVSFGFTLEKGN